MTGMGSAALEQHLDRVLRYLQSHMAFVNCHMVGYLTDNLWKTFIPETIQTEIQSLEDLNAAIEVLWNFNNQPNNFNSEYKFPCLLNFLHTSRALQLQTSSELAITVEQLNQHLHNIGFEIEERSGLEIKEFMSEKKNHEVKIAARVITTLCGSRGSEDNSKLCVIDAGDGKGYLSSRLALEHQLHVLGIDANAINTAGAQKRTTQLEVFKQNLHFNSISLLIVIRSELGVD